MPKIYLKPKSPEFDQEEPQKTSNLCEMPGCIQTAEHKAPKDRSLNHYWHFCLDHVREYNSAWNYFVGMSDHEIYEHMYKSSLWDRPTWSFKHKFHDFDEMVRDKAWHAAMGDEAGDPAPNETRRSRIKIDPFSPEGQALETMGLEPPVNLEEIKSRYKKLMKEHHPDLRKGDKESEELVKKINMAYTILKMSYMKYEKMAERFE